MSCPCLILGRNPYAAELYGATWGVNLEPMALYLVRSCPICRNYFGVVIAAPKAVESPNPSMVVVPHADTRSTGH